MDEQRIREIVREELAAHNERPEIISLSPEKRDLIDKYIKENHLKLRPTI